MVGSHLHAAYRVGERLGRPGRGSGSGSVTVRMAGMMVEIIIHTRILVFPARQGTGIRYPENMGLSICSVGICRGRPPGGRIPCAILPSRHARPDTRYTGYNSGAFQEPSRGGYSQTPRECCSGISTQACIEMGVS
jgi:hypothetical protein